MKFLIYSTIVILLSFLFSFNKKNADEEKTNDVGISPSYYSFKKDRTIYYNDGSSLEMKRFFSPLREKNVLVCNRLLDSQIDKSDTLIEKEKNIFITYNNIERLYLPVNSNVNTVFYPYLDWSCKIVGLKKMKTPIKKYNKLLCIMMKEINSGDIYYSYLKEDIGPIILTDSSGALIQYAVKW